MYAVSENTSSDGGGDGLIDSVVTPTKNWKLASTEGLPVRLVTRESGNKEASYPDTKFFRFAANCGRRNLENPWERSLIHETCYGGRRALFSNSPNLLSLRTFSRRG